MTPQQAFLDVLIPAVISAVVLLVAWRPWKRTLPDGRWGGPVALAAGFCAAVPAIFGSMPQLSPVVAPDCVFYVAIAVALVAAGESSLRLPKWVRVAIAACVLAAAFVLPLMNQLRAGSAGQSSGMLWLIGAASAGLLWWLIFERPTETTDRLAVPSAMVLLAMLSGLILTMSASFKYGRLGMALGGAVIPMLLLGLRRGFNPSGSVLVFVAVLGALLLTGKQFTDLSWLHLGLILIGPIFYLFGQLVVPQRYAAHLRVCIYLLFLVLPLILAAIPLIPSFVRGLSSEVGDYGQ